MATFTATKDPDARIRFEIDWSAYLVEDSITASSWTIENGDGSLVVESDSFDANKAGAWITGGNPNRSYVLANQVETDAGTIDRRRIELTVARL